MICDLIVKYIAALIYVWHFTVTFKSDHTFGNVGVVSADLSTIFSSGTGR